MDLGQLKILQEVITLSVFVPFAYFYVKAPLKLDFLWAELCLVRAVYFMFRSAHGTAWITKMQKGSELIIRCANNQL